ncbi:MAG: transcription-repair coupling factor [Balneolaceae bacterium]
MIKSIFNAFRKTLSEDRIKEIILKRQVVELEQFTGSTLSLLLASAAKHVTHILVLTPELEKASSIASDLGELRPDDELLLFPSTRRKPYDDQKIIDHSVLIQRSEVLERLENRDQGIVLSSAEAISEKLIAADEFQKKSIATHTGDNIDPSQLREKLTGQGYHSVKFVDEPGEFALRGGIFDVFPYSSDYPVRLEFFGDEIDSIREFDPDSQRSIAFLNEVRFVPNATFEGNTNKQSLFEYLPDNTLILLYNPDLIRNEITEIYQNASLIYAKKQDAGEELSKPENEYLTLGQFDLALRNKPLFLSGSFTESIQKVDHRIRLQTQPHPEFNGSFRLLRENIRNNSSKGFNTLILCDNQNQRERFEELLGDPSPVFQYQLGVFTLHEGFVLPEQKLSVLTDHQIFNRYHRPKLTKKKKYKGGISFKELRDLNVGDFVVHVDYGIGKFAGFKKIKVKDIVQEAAVLRYKDDSILYVNVTSLHKLQKYSGKEGTAPKITKLGSGEWARKKARTKKKVKDIARELIDLYAKRKSKEAYAFSPDNSWQTEMEARFEFEETPDQMKAIESVKQDMESEHPMDRLICGDVGFGKTEVAIRAAFKAVMDQKQVAVLVPTTILADQHFKTFSRRMEDFPIQVEVLSRFRTASEQKEVIKKLNEGKVDILIGTHRIVSKDVKFKKLGLLVIDEEQRFGVSVKEKLKEFRATVDVLTMTATPIPRTLQFSLMGARDLSIINTPPSNRQPVYTEIHSFSQDLIRDAILQEISRGGQVFFIHNRVKNIEEVADMIRVLVPDIRVRVGHGQMSSSGLEKIIHDFYNNKFNVLVSTNIVENGIDIANANTIMINNANQFGLSELHQLRGRVGRSIRKAFCYLLTPPIKTLTTEARKRLQALEEFSDLGSGFNIAMRDLDIRGAGDILGAEQSGFINEIGFDMYMKILDDAVREIKEQEYKGVFESEPAQIEYPETQVEFDYSALLDSDYVSDNVERLNLYRKLAEANSLTDISEWKEELVDRFGPLPDTAENLLLAAQIKFYSSRLFIRKVTIRATRMWLVCPANNSPQGNEFYNSGLFQDLLGTIRETSGEDYKIVQKKETVRLVIEKIKSANDAVDYLKNLYNEKNLQDVQADTDMDRDEVTI